MLYFQILTHQAGLELFSLPHPAFHRGSSPLQLPADYLRKHEDLKRATTHGGHQFRGSNSPGTDEDCSARKTPNKSVGSPKNGVEVSFSESIRKDAEKEMEEYLLKFGGISSVDTATESPITHQGEDNENDGDDEGASLDSGL